MVGGVQPGEKITLRQLTSAFGTSLMPVREAVQRLAGEGRLSFTKPRNPRPDYDQGRCENFEVLILLEGLAVEEACARIQPAAIAQLEELNTVFLCRKCACAKFSRSF